MSYSFTPYNIVENFTLTASVKQTGISSSMNK
jgi:hypothetical protein